MCLERVCHATHFAAVAQALVLQIVSVVHGFHTMATVCVTVPRTRIPQSTTHVMHVTLNVVLVVAVLVQQRAWQVFAKTTRHLLMVLQRVWRSAIPCNTLTHRKHAEIATVNVW